jgi:hypothetical protein
MNMEALIKRWIGVIVIIPTLCSAQFVEDFSDGDFSANPQWVGDITRFRVNEALQLQMNDNLAGRSCLSTPIDIIDDMEWRCWIKMAFSPSANNNARVYLLAQEACSDTFPDGIFLQLGESGSFDAIRLMKQTNGDTSTLICASAAAIAQSFTCNIRTVLENGNWSLFADYSGGEDFLMEGQSPASPQGDEGYLAIICNYTVSNSTKFYFDNFYAGPIQYDTISPQAMQVFVSPPNILEIHFSEYLDPLSAENPYNFELNNNFSHPVQAKLAEDDPAIVEVSYNDSLLYGEIMQMHIHNVKDLSGNVMDTVVLDFSWYHPQRYDVVINEIMADPSPTQYLPDHEYLELFNTTPLPLDLSGWGLTIGTAEKELTHLNIAPQGYLLLGKEDAKTQFTPFGPFYGLESFSLVNAGQNILLSNEMGELIHGLYYSEKWYQDDEKSEGGWSLEQLNPYNPCIIDDNWRASSESKGGTPGAINSVFDTFFVAP